MGVVAVAGATPELKRIVEAMGSDDVSVIDTEPTPAAIQGRADDLELLVLGEGIEDPVRLVERLGFGKDTAAILIVASPHRTAATKRSLRFAQMLTADVRCLSADQTNEIAAQVRSMAAKARRRRTFSAVLPRLQQKLPDRLTEQQRALYLDALLDYAPIGVIVLDRNDRVIDLNAEAVGVLTVGTAEALGRPLAALLPQEVRPAAQRLLQDAHHSTSGSASARVSWPCRDRERQVEFVVAPVNAGSDAGMMVVVRDVTAEVDVERAEWALREQRAVSRALEAQADELRRVNEALADRNEELQQFAYVASHDLQEPLRKIASFSDLLLEDYAEPLGEEGRFYLERMQGAATRMSELIRSLLRFSRAGTQALDLQPIDLNDVLKHVQTDLALPIAEANANIRIDELPTIEGDEGQIRQLFQNLVANAVKFRKPGTNAVVRVSAEKTPRVSGDNDRTLHRITVSDEGIGFDAQYLDVIFSPFQRLHSGSDYPGTGLGLAICRRIAERHGGSIQARSKPGEGAAFDIDLPAAA